MIGSSSNVLLVTRAAAASPPAPPVITGTPTQLTLDTATQLDPSLSGDIMVWTDQRNGPTNDDIYYCNVTNCAGTEFPIASTEANQRLHDVSGSIVVYTENALPFSTVRAFDTSTNTDLGVISPASNHSRNPRIDGPFVVYEVGTSDASDIGLTNLSTGEQTIIASTSDIEASPVVENDPATGVTRVVYERRVAFAAESDVVVLNLTTSSQTVIASGPSDQRLPDIDGNFVVYDATTSAGDRDIFVHNLSTGSTTQLSRPGDQQRPHVSGNFVTFEENSAGNFDVQLYHIPSGTFQTVAANAGNNFLTDISGNRVVYTSNQAGNFDIWMYTFAVAPPPPEQQIIDLLAFFDASLANGTLAGRGTGHAAITRRNLMRLTIVIAGELIEQGRTDLACLTLHAAYLFADGATEPPDLVVGTARPELALRIQNLRTSLGCP